MTRGAECHITVCVPTFRRPLPLAGLLQKLETQECLPDLRYEILVVDNDDARSAEPVVADFSRRSRLTARYLSEPVRGIARVRNRLIDGARGRWLAFIDDDEVPSPEWLASLHREWLRGTAAVIFGPVLPAYPPHTPEWLKRSGVCERRQYRNGEILSPLQVGGGNFYCAKALFTETGIRFSEAFDAGGEDGDLFHRLSRAGVRFAGCRDAAAFEEVADNRMRVSWWLRRAFCWGYRHAHIHGREEDGRRAFRYFAGAGIKALLLSAVLPASAAWGRAGFVRAGRLWMANVGKLAALSGRGK